MKYKIGDLAEIIDGDRGKNYPQQHEFFNDGFCLFLDAGNVTADGFRFDATHYITQEKDAALNNGRLNRGDLVYTTRGTVGNAAYYDDNVPYTAVRINSGMVILRCNRELVEERYLYHVLKSNFYRPYFKSFCTGSAQPQLPIKNLSKIELDIPDIDTQRRIAAILSAYDNLIENNRKQIKLLEEAAQRLYKEWFVDLRFPGWETTEIVDGVPMGWKNSSINELGHFVRGKTITKSNVNEGDVPVVAGGIEPAYYHNVSNTEMPVITISGSGANAGFTKIYFQKIWASDCSYVDSTGTQYIYFVYCFLKNSGDAIKKLQKGSAQPHVYAKDINALTVTIPNIKTLRSFESHIRPCFNAIANCNKIIMSATEARDRLLPKLMSGELEV